MLIFSNLLTDLCIWSIVAVCIELPGRSGRRSPMPSEQALKITAVGEGSELLTILKAPTTVVHSTVSWDVA